MVMFLERGPKSHDGADQARCEVTRLFDPSPSRAGYLALNVAHQAAGFLYSLAASCGFLTLLVLFGIINLRFMTRPCGNGPMDVQSWRFGVGIWSLTVFSQSSVAKHCWNVSSDNDRSVERNHESALSKQAKEVLILTTL